MKSILLPTDFSKNSMNAIEYAKENNYEAVTCGHTHFTEDVTVDGIRYVNTGCWTELPASYLHVDDSDIRLVEVTG